MIALAREQIDSSAAQSSGQINTSLEASSVQRVADVVSEEKMPPAHILSYLVPPTSDSRPKDADLYDELIKHTADTDSLVKGSLFTDIQPRILVFPEQLKSEQRQDFFTSLQAWEGIVLEVMPDSFWARLLDLTNTGADEEAELPMNEISDDDKPLVRPGAIFYWDIGYHTSYSGQRMRSSLIRFRRLPAWTQREIDAAEREADRIGKALGWQ
jgi:hypothetical protein